MVRSRFLGKPPKTRCQRTMVRVGVPNFVDNEAKNAKLISLALGVFRTTFETDNDEQQQEFRGFSDCTKAACSLAEMKKEITEICRQRGIPYESTVKKEALPSSLGNMDCLKVQNKVGSTPELNESTNKEVAKIISCLDDDLNYTFAKSCKGGPLNLNQTSGEVQCGICGVVRFYKSIAKTKKYGAYSCDSCRKFITKSIDNTKVINRCNNERGIGQCRIPIGIKSQNRITRVISIDTRCKACWLQMCLKRLKLPEATIERLLDTLPIEMVPIILWTLKKPDPWTISIDSTLQKKIICDYNLHKEIINALRDEDSDENTDEIDSNEDSHDDSSDNSDSDIEYIAKKKCYSKKSKLEEKPNKRKGKTKRARKIEFCREVQSNDIRKLAATCSKITPTSNLTNESKSFVAKGPRVKHVCRSAESVFGQTPATFKNVSDKNENALEVNSLLKTDYFLINKNEEKDECLSDSGYGIMESCSYSKSSKFSTPVDSYSSFQPNRTLQDLMMQDHINANNENIEDQNTVDLDFRESYDPDRIAENGFAVVGTEPLLVPRGAVCYLCGSAGMEKLIHCVTCCEPYHKFCVDGVGIGIPSHESEWSKISWTCPKCKLCKGCQSRGKTRPKLTCQRCKDSYHDNCLKDKLTYDRNRPWACPSCRKCKSCKVPRVDYFVGNLALCAVCFHLRQRGNYCPLCQQCYNSDDYDSKMMECAVCKHWVHAKCEGLSNERYEVLSILPDVVEYVCKSCTTESTVPWRSYVDEALKNGFKTVLISLGKNKKTCDLIKWSPQKQSPGCVCKKYIPPFPSLDGGSTIVDQKLNNDDISKQCVCHGLEGWSKGTPTLVTIKQKINNNEYESLCQFNIDMLNTIDKFNAPELKEEYRKIVYEVFPWFSNDFQDNSPRKSSYLSSSLPIISPPKFIPKLSLNLLNSDIKALQDMMGNDENSYYVTPKNKDNRICQFCKKVGEGMPVREGRLLYCGDNIWAHANCALWSSEVFEEIDGSLQNVQLALSRSKLVRCVVCNEKGASIGCCYRNCVKTYHFQCARKVFCVFNENKTVYCNNHASDTRCNVKDFTLERLIYIEQEDIKQKRIESSEIHILIGSLYISCIGHLHPFLSDTIESILPVDFKAKRYYWSTKEPWKLIQYDWLTKVENLTEKFQFDDINLTIDHDLRDNNVDIVEPKKDVNINLFTSVHLDDLDKCYEILKRTGPIHNVKTKYCKMDDVDCFAYHNYESDTELSTIDETCRMELFSHSYGHKTTSIPQLDGLYDSSDDSEFDLYHIDKLTDVIDDCTNDQPVKCDRCHRTYRTSISFERHLPSCNFDYELGSDSDSSEDEKSENKIESNCIPEIEEKALHVEPIKEQSNLISQQNYIPVTQIQPQQPPPTVILQPMPSFVQPQTNDVQYITINNPPTQPLMPCFQYQQQPTVIVQPTIDPTTVVLNNPSMDMFLTQSNNLLFSSQPMIMGLDQTFNMASSYTFTQSPQIYPSPKPVEAQNLCSTTQMTNQYYIINTEPTTVSNEWSYNITSEIKAERKIIYTPQPKVYSNRRIKSTECYDTKENIPNSLVKSVQNQAYSVMNIIRNVNPEPWKKQNIKTYPPKKIEEKKILPKSISTYLTRPSITKKAIETKTSSPIDINNVSTSNIKEKMLSPSPLKTDVMSTIKVENKYSPTKPEYKTKICPINMLKVMPFQTCNENQEFDLPLKTERESFVKIEKNSSTSSPKLENQSDSYITTLPVSIEVQTSLSPPLKRKKLSCDKLTEEKSLLNPDTMASPSVNETSHSSLVVENQPLGISKVDTSHQSLFTKDKHSTIDQTTVAKSLSHTSDVSNLVFLNTEKDKSVQQNTDPVNGKVKLLEPVSNPFEKYLKTSSPHVAKNGKPQQKQTGRQWSTAMSDRERTVPQLMFEMNSADGVFCKDRSLVEIWSKLFEAVQVSRNERKMPPLPSSNPFASDITAAIRSLGLSNNFLKYLLEQLSEAKEFVKYKPTYHKGFDVVGSTAENPSGCARTEIIVRKNRYDMFSWLASRHRKPPKLLANNEDFGGRRANSLPNEMKYRNMNKTLTTTVGVYRSDIHGRGLFCLRDIEQGEYVIEYTGEVIRSVVSDVRERLYNKKGIDCYMFRIDQDIVIDATMNGNSSRFINHSCEPNCQSKIETIHGKKHIMILAKRKVLQGEELTYDYKFPLEDDKITCHCLSRRCRKYLN